VCVCVCVLGQLGRGSGQTDKTGRQTHTHRGRQEKKNKNQSSERGRINQVTDRPTLSISRSSTSVLACIMKGLRDLMILMATSALATRSNPRTTCPNEPMIGGGG
jgi:hypothetical protein